MLPDTPASQAALFVTDLLTRRGHQALLAGGCVRDMLMGLDSSDYDVATSARPDQVAEIFHRVLMVGAQFGVAIVLYKGQQVEVATFRSETAYSDGRHPDQVSYSDPRQDALRRDFTINGMFYDPVESRVIDYVGGTDDLRAGIVRTIGNPDRRFEEDYLRMLRGPRFAVRFDFTLESRTAEAIARHAANITSISGERILDELTKMLSRDSAARAVEQLHRLGLLEHICPGLYDPPERFERGLRRMGLLPVRDDATLNLAALLAELPAKAINQRCRHWGAGNDLRKKLTFLAGRLNDWARAADLDLAAFKRLAAGEHFQDLLHLWRAQEQLETGRDERTRAVADRLAALDPASIDPPPLIDGSDLKDMGLAQGPKIGRILKEIRDLQLAEQITDRDQALAEARKRIGS